MELRLSRTHLTKMNTVGRLFVNGQFHSLALEDVVRAGPKVAHETAIPAGKYNVVIGPSPKFKRLMIRVEDVPGFTGILIHPGNTEEDTWGCILLGYHLDDYGHIAAGTSTPAVAVLQAVVRAALDRKEPVTLTITNDFPESPGV